jgi:hypothetical protein
MMDIVGTVVEQTQRLLDKGFLLSAYLPLATTTLAVWVEVSGTDGVSATLVGLADGTASAAIVGGGLTLVGLYLAAFVVHGLRRAVRDAWSGAIPAPLIREAMVSRRFQRYERLHRRLVHLGYGLGAAFWLLEDDLDPAKVGGAEAAPSGSEAVDALARRCDAQLRLLRRRWTPFASERAGHLLVDLHRLANADPSTTAAQQSVNSVRQARMGRSPSDQRAADRLSAAAVRLEQRFRTLEDHLDTSYPPSTAMQATRLGNVLARTEHYSTLRYDIPLQTLWPRLRLVAPERQLSDVEDALVRIDFALAMTTGGVLASAAGLGMIPFDGPTTERVLIGLGAAAAAAGLYRFAVVAAHLYGAQIAATIDLNLPELGGHLEKLGASAVNWDALHHFFERGDPLSAPTDPTGRVGARLPGEDD